MIFGAILAGGVGSRMNIESMPKQYLPLNEKPVFIHTLEKFLLCSEFDAVFIGTHGDWVEYTKDAVAQYGNPYFDVDRRVARSGMWERRRSQRHDPRDYQSHRGTLWRIGRTRHRYARLRASFRESVDHQGEY